MAYVTVGFGVESSESNRVRNLETSHDSIFRVKSLRVTTPFFTNICQRFVQLHRKFLKNLARFWKILKILKNRPHSGAAIVYSKCRCKMAPRKSIYGAINVISKWFCICQIFFKSCFDFLSRIARLNSTPEPESTPEPICDWVFCGPARVFVFVSVCWAFFLSFCLIVCEYDLNVQLCMFVF